MQEIQKNMHKLQHNVPKKAQCVKNMQKCAINIHIYANYNRMCNEICKKYQKYVTISLKYAKICKNMQRMCKNVQNIQNMQCICKIHAKYMQNVQKFSKNMQNMRNCKKYAAGLTVQICSPICRISKKNMQKYVKS